MILAEQKAKSAGYLALLLWSLSAVILSLVQRVPATQALCLTLGICGLCSLIRLTYLKKWGEIQQAWHVGLILNGLFFLGNDWFYFHAFHWAPALQVDLIAWLWPVLLILVSVWRKPHLSYYAIWLSLFFGIASFVAMVSHDLFTQALVHHAYLLGWGAAAMGAFMWVAYCLQVEKTRSVPVEMLGLYSLVGCGFFYFSSDHHVWVVLTMRDWFLLGFIGFFCSTLAYWLWAYAMQEGMLVLVSISAYITPSLSIVWLILCHQASWYAGSIWGMIFLLLSTFFSQRAIR